MRRARLGLTLAVACIVFGQSSEPVRQEDLVAYYERYSGSQLVVSGEVVSGPEMTVMYLPGASTDSGGPAGMLITFSEALSKKPGALEKRFIKALKKTGRADAVLSGRFEGAAGRKWGHQACCQFRLEIDRVISLK